MTVVFVVGAGASVEFGFPTGPALQETIARFLRRNLRDELDFDRRLVEIIDDLTARHGVSYSDFLETAKWMSEALPLAPSIDSFLETHSSGSDLIGDLGKFSIAAAIAEAEHRSPLFQDPRNNPDFTLLTNSWLGQMWKKGVAGVRNTSPERALSNFRFLTFNYDRCIEQFVILAYCKYFRCNIIDAVSLLKSRPVEHVYGSLGPIDGHGSFFGQVRAGSQIFHSIDGLMTYSEQVATETHTNITNMISNSDIVIFLGFSFASINRDFLHSTILDGSRKRVYGTCLGMSDLDTRFATSWANREFRSGLDGATMINSTAADFFSQGSLIF
jgi:hypothetical protein